MRIAVAGGTGTVGRHVVAAAEAAGHDVVLLTRGAGVDLITGAGLDAALEGADAAIDTVNPSGRSDAAVFFPAASGNLVAAAARAGVGHVVLLSIVGIDRNPHEYYAAKIAQEKAFAASTVPWTVLRATQFHEFARQMFEAVKLGPLHLAPRGRTQPIAAREVGAHLVELAVGSAQGLAAELAGPREERLADMVKSYARVAGYRFPVFGVDLPGPQMAGMREGLNLPGPGAVLGTQTFDEWLAEVRAARA